MAKLKTVESLVGFSIPYLFFCNFLTSSFLMFSEVLKASLSLKVLFKKPFIFKTFFFFFPSFFTQKRQLQAKKEKIKSKKKKLSCCEVYVIHWLRFLCLSLSPRSNSCTMWCFIF